METLLVFVAILAITVGLIFGLVKILMMFNKGDDSESSVPEEPAQIGSKRE